MDIDMNDFADNLISFANGLGKLFGYNCEIALYNYRGIDYELFHVVNNHVTHRKAENNMNNYELDAFTKAQAHNGHTVFSYNTKDGRSFKAALFILDVKHDEYTIMIITYDVTDFLLLKKVFQDFSTTEERLEGNLSSSIQGNNENIDVLMQNIVSSVINDIGKPISYLSKEDKVRIVKLLDEKGIFLIKGAVEYVADKLCVSRYTIYNYLEETR